MVTTTASELISIVYVSASNQLLEDNEILEILRVSRRNNEREDLTGMLLYHEGSFMQVLEGPRTAVEHRVSIIKRDPRHRAWMELVCRPIEERQFGEWKMGFQNVDAAPESEKAAVSDFLASAHTGGDTLRGGKSAAYKLLRSFKANNL